MDLGQIKEVARQTMGERLTHPYREPGFIFHHGQRVGNLALQLRELIFPGAKENDAVLLVGGWFHDLGKGLEPHWETGPLLAGEILKNHCPKEQLEQIKEIIGGHTLRKKKAYPPYVQLVQDADLLDHFGTLEIWLNFWYTAGTKGTVSDALHFYQTEYKTRVEQVRPLLNYAQSQEFFEERDGFVGEFMERLQREGAGKLF